MHWTHCKPQPDKCVFIYHYYGVVSRFKKRGLTPQISHMFSIVILVILSRGVVLQCLGPTSYVVQVADRTMHVHVDHLSINQCSFPFKRSRVLTVHVFVGSLARKRKKLTNSSPRSKTRSLSPWWRAPACPPHSSAAPVWPSACMWWRNGRRKGCPSPACLGTLQGEATASPRRPGNGRIAWRSDDVRQVHQHCQERVQDTQKVQIHFRECLS